MTTEHPTNHELLEEFKAHTKTDEAFQEKTDKAIEGLATKDDVREIFADELKNFFKVSGMNTKAVILTIATIVGALTVIFGGLKAMLAWLGFAYLK